MRISGLVYQQICQIRWHLLACLGLVMILPIEEAFVNLREGDGFFSRHMVALSVAFAPLLAGLVACANVQADLNERRYIFWRSKPVGAGLFMSVKFAVGLIGAIVILACPLAFGLVSTAFGDQELVETDINLYKYTGPFLLLAVTMAYSVCFACGVIVRKTARSWLIGMLLACFLLVCSFILSLDFKDFADDVVRSRPTACLATMLVSLVIALGFAILATRHDWHLKTSLRGMMWAGAGLLFGAQMLFGHEMANIKVLDEKEVIPERYGHARLNYAGNRIIYGGHSYVDVNENSISLRRIEAGCLGHDVPVETSIRLTHKGYGVKTCPQDGRLYRRFGDDIYDFIIYAYYHTEGKPSQQRHLYEKVCLVSYKHAGESWTPVCELDISDCLTDRRDYARMAMRLIDNRLIVCVNDSCVVMDVTDPAEIDRVETRLDVFEGGRRYIQDRQKPFTITLLPIESINIQERIRLSIELQYGYIYAGGDISRYSIVDVHEGKIGFVLARKEDIARFDVSRWDDENIYCDFVTARPFTFLERLIADPYYYGYPKLFRNGKLYMYHGSTLMVFDVRSGSRVRKLGHFVRMKDRIEDIAVVENGNILLRTRQDALKDMAQRQFLYLLKNPG